MWHIVDIKSVIFPKFLPTNLGYELKKKGKKKLNARRCRKNNTHKILKNKKE